MHGGHCSYLGILLTTNLQLKEQKESSRTFTLKNNVLKLFSWILFIFKFFLAEVISNQVASFVLCAPVITYLFVFNAS